MKVSDLEIHDEYDIVDLSTTIIKAAKKMKEKDIPDLVVVSAENKPLGIVTESLIVRHVVATGKDPNDVRVEDIMQKVNPLSSDTHILDATKTMTENNLPLVPVVEEGKLIGVVTISDVLVGLKELELKGIKEKLK